MLKESEIIYQNAVYTVFLDIETSELQQIQQTLLSRTQEICHIIKIFSGSSLGEVQLYQISSL